MSVKAEASVFSLSLGQFHSSLYIQSIRFFLQIPRHRITLTLNERDIPGSQGRRGLGNIYVWASGDGGEEDDCNCDGYAASMWTVSINSAINDGQNAHYDESCSSTLASTFSNGAKDPNIGVVSGVQTRSDLCVRCQPPAS